MRNINYLFVVGFIFLNLAPPPSMAATRTAHFTQSGRNVTDIGLGENATSKCIITLANPSAVAQDFTLLVRLQVSGTHASTAPVKDPVASASSKSTGATASCDAPTSTTAPSASSSTISCNGALATNESVTYSFNYPTYSSKTGGTTAGVQTISCSGTITASDPTSSNPGFLIGTGNLTIFSEGGEFETDSTTAAGTADDFGGQAVYSQIPILINRSKPF